MSITVSQPVAGSAATEAAVEAFMEEVVAQSPGEVEFHQAVHEVAKSVMPVIEANPAYREARILERLVVPDTVIMFGVVWTDDDGHVHVSRGYRGRISVYAEQFPGTEYLPGKRPWSVPCDLAFPIATQNEVDEGDARQLVANGCGCVSEGANMPSTPAAVDVFQNAGILYGPGKAANAGGVAVSGLEMNQNAAA